MRAALQRSRTGRAITWFLLSAMVLAGCAKKASFGAASLSRQARSDSSSESSPAAASRQLVRTAVH